MAVEWSDALLLGMEELDQQHRALVQFQIRLENALQSNPQKDQIYSYLTDVLEYARIHFATEEAFMRPHAAALPSYYMHLEQHREFEQLAVEFLQRFQAEGTTLGREVFAFIGSWTLSHIKVTDRAMRDELRALGVLK